MFSLCQYACRLFSEEDQKRDGSTWVKAELADCETIGLTLYDAHRTAMDRDIWPSIVNGLPTHVVETY